MKPNALALLNHPEGSREQQKEMETGEDEEMGTVFRTKGFSSR
jgi:hypothetical protein